MKIGLIGLPKSGKTTIFNALTGLDIETNAYSSGKAETNLAEVKVLDPRITKLSEMYNPKKTIYANIEYLDFSGMSEGDAQNGLFDSQNMGLLKNTDALALVVRNFQDSVLNDTFGIPGILRDLNTVENEFLISDLIIAEKRLEKIELGYKRGIKTPAIQLEEKVIRTIIDHLNNSLPLRTLQLSEDEDKSVRGFQFISQKPLLIIVNSDESTFRKSADILTKLQENYLCVEFAGKFEMELSKLDEEEASLFMEDMNITESAKNLLTKLSYQLLGYISFFTVGTDEVRAWTISNGENALEAAGKIHSDLARGFIRAETFSYDDLMKFGTEKSTREHGHFRLEGKTYLVKDGDIINIRFSV